MSLSANVRSIQALGEMKGSLRRFAGEVQSPLNAAMQDSRRTLEWLSERCRYWQRQIEYWKDEVAAARLALMSAVISPLMIIQATRQLNEAQRRLREAKRELHKAQRWSKMVQQASTDYQRQTQRLANLLANDLPKATGLLDRSITILQSYAEMSGSSGISVPTSSSSSTLADEELPQQTDEEPEEHNPPLGPKMPPEIREGSIGGPERRG